MLMTYFSRFSHKMQDRVFRLVHGNRLVYNTCWEDPRLDRTLLGFGSDSRIVMITSAGDNALAYLLDDPAEVHCVDVNYRQNALLELKRVLYTQAGADALFAFFGSGGSSECAAIYEKLRPGLPDYAASFWDENLGYFSNTGSRKSFYYHGASGVVAWIFSRAMGLLKPKVRARMIRLMDASDLEEQRRLFHEIEPAFWDRVSSWLVGRPTTMAMLGVPRPQVALIREKHPGGVQGFVKDKIRRVFTELPISENYFWRVYVTGQYTRQCCPDYLQAEHFSMLRERVFRLHLHTCTLSSFLRRNPGQYTHFILLDHQDWLAWHAPEALREEWELLLGNAAPGAKVLMRTAGLDVSFVPDAIRKQLCFQPELTEKLHFQDRVGTYGSQHLAVVL